MQFFRYIQAVKTQYRLIALFSVVGLLTAAVAVFAQPLRFGATSRVLVIQRATAEDLDPYTAIKSAERIADNLSRVVHTQDFLNKVLAQDPTIDQTRFPLEPRKRLRVWEKTVASWSSPGTGFLGVTALSTDKEEAKKISQAAADVLTLQGKDYIGGNIEVKLVDTPVTSRFPVSPNIPIGLFTGFLLGTLAGLATVLWKESQRTPEL